MGQRKNKLSKKERKALKLLQNNINMFCDVDEPLYFDENYPDSGQIHYTDFVCSHCGIHENIPTHIVMQLEDLDRDMPNYMPSFSCEKCGYNMYPTYFKGYTGKIYRYKFKD